MRVPTIQELINSIVSSIETQFGTLNRGLRATYRVLAQVLSAQLRLVYLYGARIQRNLFPDLADTEANQGTLERWGRARLGRNPFAATAGRYTATVNGQIGGVIRQNLTYRAGNGFLYAVETRVELTATTGQVTLLALQPGLDARLSIGDVLNATEPILDVDQTAETLTELTTPINAEPIESYRAAIIQSFRTESQGGASGDYRLWAADAQGVRQVYPNVPSPGDINLYVEANVADSTDGKGTPSQTILDLVDSVVRIDPDDTLEINQRGRLPLDVFNFDALPITPIDVNLVIQDYTGDATADRQTIINAINDYLLTIRPYIPGADPVDLSTLFVNRIIGAVADALGTGRNFTNIEMRIGTNTNPVNSHQFLNGDIPALNDLTINTP